MVRASGCRVWDADGREYVDYVMALGAVALGYGHPAVNRAAEEAIAAGVVGPLPPVLEEELAEALCHRIPWIERVRFLKTGAEAVAAAVRLARVVTGRERVLGCGYHGWLDWCQGAEGVPAATRTLYAELPFNDPERTRRLIRDAGDRLAVVVVEPVVVTEPTREWLEVVQAETRRVGAVLVFDEIKTAFRQAVGGAAERYGVRPDVVVLGKALANGFPLAALGGRAELMAAASRTWISSTLPTESVALAAPDCCTGCTGCTRRTATSSPVSVASPRCVSSTSSASRSRATWRGGARRAGCCSSGPRTTSSRWRTTRLPWTARWLSWNTSSERSDEAAVTLQRKLLLGFSLMVLPTLLVGVEAIRTNALERGTLETLRQRLAHSRTYAEVEDAMFNQTQVVWRYLSGDPAARKEFPLTGQVVDYWIDRWAAGLPPGDVKLADGVRQIEGEIRAAAGRVFKLYDSGRREAAYLTARRELVERLQPALAAVNREVYRQAREFSVQRAVAQVQGIVDAQRRVLWSVILLA